MLECVVNVSEGGRSDVLAGLAEAAGGALRDLQADAAHGRSVFTLIGPEAEEGARSLAARAVEVLDLRTHHGAHPRFGVVDVVPFVPLEGTGMEEAVGARDGFARWAAGALGLPCFLYGPERDLPHVRRHAFRDLAPDTGPGRPHPTAGAAAVGARPVMVAYNLWLDGSGLERAREAARRLRGPAVRALAFHLGGAVQLSFNLVDPARFGPADAYDGAAALGLRIARAELVGLAPAAVLEAVDRGRWEQLDLSPDRTIEARAGGGSWSPPARPTRPGAVRDGEPPG